MPASLDKNSIINAVAKVCLLFAPLILMGRVGPLEWLFAEVVMADHKAQVVWTGNLDKGCGELSSASGVIKGTVRLLTRTIESIAKETTPEELLASAHAACLSMMVEYKLGAANHSVQKLQTEVVVTVESSAEGLKITRAGIQVVGHGPSAKLNASTFQKLVQEAEKGCPVSNALRNNVQIRVQGKLV